MRSTIRHRGLLRSAEADPCTAMCLERFVTPPDAHVKEME